MKANHCQSAVWVRQSASGPFIPTETSSASFTENETEVSFFSRDLYESFKLNPEVLPLFSRYLIVSYISRRLGGKVESHAMFLEGIMQHIEWHCVYYSGSKGARNGSI